ncbi:MAG TPA: glycosyltransferase family 2 protein [Acidimicrobiia bacterium]|jgi:hypothetical protein|nr:glycosyltransferase family 2 protein [Acidimicrobiia bacterium]
MTATLDVVIVAYDSRATIGSCVRAARALPGVGEVLVVDHGRDGSAAEAQDAGAGVVRDTSNPGFGAGQNHGVRETTAPFVLLCNPDAVVDAVGVAAGARLLADDPSVAAVQGVIVHRGSGSPERSQGRELGPVHLLGRAVGARRLLRHDPARRLARRIRGVADHVDRVPTTPTAVESLAATALLVRRRAFDQVRGFDSGYFLYGEDLDLCRRLRADGWRLVALPERFAVHDGGGSSVTPVGRELAWWRGTLRFAARWWSRPAWCAAVAAAALAWLRLSVRHPARAGDAARALFIGPGRDRRERRVAATRAARPGPEMGPAGA